LLVTGCEEHSNPDDFDWSTHTFPKFELSFDAPDNFILVSQNNEPQSLQKIISDYMEIILERPGRKAFIRFTAECQLLNEQIDLHSRKSYLKNVYDNLNAGMKANPKYKNYKSRYDDIHFDAYSCAWLTADFVSPSDLPIHMNILVVATDKATMIFDIRHLPNSSLRKFVDRIRESLEWRNLDLALDDQNGSLGSERTVLRYDDFDITLRIPADLTQDLKGRSVLSAKPGQIEFFREKQWSFLKFHTVFNIALSMYRLDSSVLLSPVDGQTLIENLYDKFDKTMIADPEYSQYTSDRNIEELDGAVFGCHGAFKRNAPACLYSCIYTSG